MDEIPIPRKKFLTILGSAILGLLVLPSFLRSKPSPLKKRRLPFLARKEPRAIASQHNTKLS